MPKKDPTKNFTSIKIPGSDFATDIVFPGTQGRLGLPPKGFDQRRKAKNRLKIFDLGEELI